MDNLYSTFCAVQGLIGFASETSLGELEGNVNAIALFNHEEVSGFTHISTFKILTMWFFRLVL